MKKRAISTLLAMCMVLMLPIVADAEELPKLATPTELEWGIEYDTSGNPYEIPGKIFYKINTLYGQGGKLKVYRSGEDTPIIDTGWTEEDSGICQSDFFLGDWDSGTYYFTVQSLGDGANYSNSEIAISTTWAYTKPLNHMGQITPNKWEGSNVSWSYEGSDLYLYQYEAELFFSETANGNFELYCYYEGLGDIQEARDQFNEMMRLKGAGYYKYRVRALSSDITKYQHGPWSEMSEAYHFDSAPAPSATPLTKSMFAVDTTPETYDGSAKTKTITSSLTQGVDYTVSYSDNVSVGTATITIMGKGNYSGTLTYTFTIQSTESTENIPQQMGNWNSYGKKSKKLGSINLTTENERQQFVKFLLGQNYLEETDNAYKTQMYEKLYALLYTTNYKPDKLGGFKVAWPFLNNAKSGSVLSNKSTGIGDINWYRSCQGCYAYANFANQFFFDKNNKDASAEKYTYYYHTFIGLDNVSQLKQEDITTEQVKAFVEQFASPGEQIRFYHNAKGPLYTWTNMHSVLYLGENAEKTGFYALSYLGSNSYSGLEINFYDYSDFAANIGLRGLDTLRVLGNFRDPSNEVNYYNGIMHMDVRCPVEVAVTYEDECLSSLDTEEATASFGSLKRNRENKSIHLELVYRPDYDINIWGTDTGTMDLSLSYIDENDVKDTRSFEMVPIKETTNISVLAYAGENDTLLYLDPHSNGTEMEIWSAAQNETSTGLSTDKMFTEGFNINSEPIPTPSNSGNSGGGGSSTPSYSITAPTVANGKVTLSSKSAEKGSKVEVIATPDDGYKLETLTVTDNKGEVIELTDLGEGKYSFTMPASKVEVKAVFTEEIPVELPPAIISVAERFTDIKEADWFVEAVQYACDNGLMNGMSADTFAPQIPISRAMLVTILHRLEGEPSASAPSFSDVAEGKYYATAVAWASTNGLVNGFEDHTFRPDGNMTREQLATLLYRYAAMKGRNVTQTANLSAYADVNQISRYALPAMEWANATGLLTGTDWGGLAPQTETTRAEAAAILMRFCEGTMK